MKNKIMIGLLIFMYGCFPHKTVQNSGGIILDIEICSENNELYEILNNYEIIKERVLSASKYSPVFVFDTLSGHLNIEIPKETDTAFFKNLVSGKGEFRTSSTYKFSDYSEELIEANNLISEVFEPDMEIEEPDTTGLNDMDPLLRQVVESNYPGMGSNNEYIINNKLFALLTPNFMRDTSGNIIPSETATFGFAKSEDTAKINAMLNDERIRVLFPRDMQFVWSVFPNKYLENLYELFALSSFQERFQLDNSAIDYARQNYDKEKNLIFNIALKQPYDKHFEIVTTTNIGNQVAMLFNNKVYSAPNVNASIPTGKMEISGNFDEKELSILSAYLNYGALTCNVNIKSLQLID
jgi:SecD/SecF fusion protein